MGGVEVVSLVNVAGKEGVSEVFVKSCAGRRESGRLGKEWLGVSPELAFAMCPVNAVGDHKILLGMIHCSDR